MHDSELVVGAGEKKVTIGAGQVAVWRTGSRMQERSQFRVGGWGVVVARDLLRGR